MKKLILALTLSLIAAPAFADEIQLVSGEIFSGRILARDEHAVYLQAQGFIRNFNVEEILFINREAMRPEKDDSTSAAARVYTAEPGAPALPYPLLAFAYQALGQTQLTFDPYSSALDSADAQHLRSIFILTDRSLAAFVQTLLWRQSGGREGRSDALLHFQIRKIMTRLQGLEISAALEPFRLALLEGIRSLDRAFESKVQPGIFEQDIAAATAGFERARFFLMQQFPEETQRNKTAWSCHLDALISIERGLRS